MIRSDGNFCYDKYFYFSVLSAEAKIIVAVALCQVTYPSKRCETFGLWHNFVKNVNLISSYSLPLL